MEVLLAMPVVVNGLMAMPRANYGLVVHRLPTGEVALEHVATIVFEETNEITKNSGHISS